ncbi:MAG: HAD family phosphatase [Candidatus Omnitrophota bacterium]|jgi:putative hydrolase of the HAD superfamily
MPPQEIKVFLFDLGNVLVDFNHRIALERISAFCDKSPADLEKFFFESSVTGAFERGEVAPEEFFRLVKEALGLRLGYDSFVSIWNEVFSLNTKNRAVYHIVNSLRQKYRTALLSNTNILHYKYLKENFPVFGVLHEQFLSFEMGLVKPQEQIYEKVIAALGVLPENIFYTDDRKELVACAGKMGLKGFVFTSAEQLIKDISSCGIKI